MLLALLLAACAPDEDTDPAGPVTSELRSELAGPVSVNCDGDELSMQLPFVGSVPRVEAEVRTGGDSFELHEVPFGGMDEDTETIFIYELKLHTGADQPDANHTVYTCDEAPFAGFRMYDDAGAIMGCYFGDFVVDFYDQTGCPAD
jgi:hypothetical protein